MYSKSIIDFVIQVERDHPDERSVSDGRYALYKRHSKRAIVEE
jgi:hypothetical protein